jgi:disulfide bond formation protein DsbB
MVGLVERSWQVLAVERGWVFGNCEMDLGMPTWFALDKWIPSLFEVQTSCGYTPLILFDISMAEVLLVFSVLLLIISAALFIASWHD